MRKCLSGIRATRLLASLVLALASAAAAAETAPLRAGAAKRIITPSDAQIAGQTESYAGGTRRQFFHLGGFGIGPVKILPSYGGVTPAFDITQAGNAEARARCFNKARLDAGVTQMDDEHCGEDHTWVRVLTLEQPGGARVAFVTLDAVGAGNLIQDGLKAAIVQASCAANACLEPANILIGQTHTHAGADLQGLWGGVPRAWINQVLYQAAAQAVSEALQNAAPAQLTMARGYDGDFNSYRRPKANGDEESDTTVSVLQARRIADDAVIGTLLQYAAHPTSVGTGDYRAANGQTYRVPHGDYPLGAELELERVYGGTALYYNGPIADASASGPTPGSNKYEQVKNRGRALAQRAIQFLNTQSVPLDPVISARHADVVLPITNPAFVALGAAGAFNGYYQFTQIPRDDIPGLDALDGQIEAVEAARNQLPQLTPVARTLVSRISIGTADAADPDRNRLEIVTIPGEATNTFGQYIRRLANESATSEARPEVHTMLLGLTQNSFGYIIPEEEFGEWEGPIPTALPYEETVSLGPLTAPLLRSEGYIPLFEAAPSEHVPEYARGTALLDGVLARLAGLADDLAGSCHDFAGDTPIAPVCGLFDALADLLGGVPAPGGDLDPQLLLAAADAQLRGCDPLDPAHCLYPFPSDHYTLEVPKNDTENFTGRRVNFSPLAMPRNLAGKPIDPSEWNRNDGFSPGALIATYVPGLSLEQTYDAPHEALGIADIRRALTAEATANGWVAPPILLLEVTDEDDADSREHLFWAEMDVNAGMLLPTGELGGGENVARQNPRVSLLLRPARNLTPGKRYVVVLRNLKDADGNPIPAGAAFRSCRDGIDSALPPIAARCEALEERVFPVLARAGIARDESLYLAWDFTVASAQNLTARLTHMRDDAFKSLRNRNGPLPFSLPFLGDLGPDCSKHVEPATLPADPAQLDCAPPKFTIESINTNADDGKMVSIEGTLTVPSYLRPADTSPLEDPNVQGLFTRIRQQFPQSASLFGGLEIATSGSVIPPNRLNYHPDAVPGDVNAAAYGDGLPDRTAAVGEMSTKFTCEIPKSAWQGGAPARASLYGHGLLQSRAAITYDGNRNLGGPHNVMFCALDWFGFAQGDLPNVASTLVDMSNFPVIPDASQQGMLNWMFLARAMQHPAGFASRPEFRVNGDANAPPAFDRREVFYYGNSQGGILPGPVVAVSKDVNRGVFGVPGMNYSTLLRRSSDFGLYSVPLYLSYQDELDRNLVFGLVQMLWDRAENNGYAAYLTEADAAVHGGLEDDANLDGQDNYVLLHPAFGDHQVTMWSVDVMARTMNVPVDRRQVSDARHPDVVPYYDLVNLQYAGSPGRAEGGAMVVWNDTNNVFPPPIDEVPPEEGRDPHGYPRSHGGSICQMSHFLRVDGFIADVQDLPQSRDAAKALCDARFGAVPTVALAAYGANAASPPSVDGLREGLAACYTHPLRDDCVLKPLVELLSVNQRNECFVRGLRDPACPVSVVLNPLVENDPSGAIEPLADILSDVIGCAVQPKAPFCQFSDRYCDVDPSGQICAIRDALGVVYALNDQLGLPITGPSAGNTACDQPAGDPAPGSNEWRQRDLMNMVCSAQRLTDQYANPDFHLALLARSTPRTYSYNLVEQLSDPTRPRLTLAQTIPGGRSTDPYRVDEDWAFAGRGRVDHVSFIAESGARLVGRVFRPPATVPGPYPAIVITTGSIQGYQEMYNWAAQGLAEAGYLVLTYDVQGQGRSETFPHADNGLISGTQGVPFQQAYNFVQGTRDALRWLLSSEGNPYRAPSANTLGTELFNPFAQDVDRTRIGLAGHSLGASAVSQVGQEQACDPGQPRALRNGCVSAIVGWDALSAVAPIKAPGLSLTAEYFFNPTPASSPPNPDSGLAAFNAFVAAGVDSMRVSLRSSTHLEWTYVPLILPASRYGERVSMYYTLAWFDRYLRDDAGATARLVATHFDDSADASSIGAGTWDPVSGNNVPYKIDGRCVANHVSIYYRSAYRLNGGTLSEPDLRARGCGPLQDADGDLIPDEDDNCPNDVNPDQADGDRDGIGDACEPPPDTTPDPFSFTSVSGVSQNTVVSSNVVTITGIDAPAPVSVSNGEYRIDGGAWTSVSGSITNGQTVQVRHTSASTANSVTETVLTIGGVSGKFRSTTAAGVDTDPDAFS
ncbi:MAG TPA: hypothetical protein VNJ47_00505, partial [Nevskiales bacterium]|nr:hypothetical protein [Nevskiales bacterium]